jgi:mannose-6-phosphate isomerase-like protein (cupin superfamily)
MQLSRRDLCVLLPGVILPAALFADALAAQTTAAPPAEPNMDTAPANFDPPLIASGGYPFDQLPVHHTAASDTRALFKGKLATGEHVEVHETTLPAGGSPHPPHHHLHSEMWLIREGTIEITIDGKSTDIGPGSGGFVASMLEHGIKNIGATPATYFVVAIGPTAGLV